MIPQAYFHNYKLLFVLSGNLVRNPRRNTYYGQQEGKGTMFNKAGPDEISTKGQGTLIDAYWCKFKSPPEIFDAQFLNC